MEVGEEMGEKMKKFREIQSVFGDLTCIDLDKVVAFQDIERDQSFITRVWVEGSKNALDLNIAYCQFVDLMQIQKKVIRRKRNEKV